MNINIRKKIFEYWNIFEYSFQHWRKSRISCCISGNTANWCLVPKCSVIFILQLNPVNIFLTISKFVKVSWFVYIKETRKSATEHRMLQHLSTYDLLIPGGSGVARERVLSTVWRHSTVITISSSTHLRLITYQQHHTSHEIWNVMKSETALYQCHDCVVNWFYFVCIKGC